MVLVATVVLVVMDPVDPCLDSCVRRRSHRRSHSHQSRNGAPVAVVVVVAEVVVAEAMQGEVVVGCSFCVVMGATRKKFSPPKTVSWEHLFLPVATQYISWEVRFTHRNERRPRLKSISALAPSGLPPQWKGRNFLKVHQSNSKRRGWLGSSILFTCCLSCISFVICSIYFQLPVPLSVICFIQLATATMCAT